MTLKKSGITAAAQEVDGEFTVLEGSSARSKWTGVAGHSYSGLLERLVHDGTLVPSPDGLSMRFARNHVFASPSAAAAAVAGRTANGRAGWLVESTRTTYGQWETEGVEAAMKPEAFRG